MFKHSWRVCERNLLRVSYPKTIAKEVPELNHTLVGYSGGVSVASDLVPGLDLGIQVLFTLKQNLT